jgi:hypothetical protein
MKRIVHPCCKIWGNFVKINYGVARKQLSCECQVSANLKIILHSRTISQTAVVRRLKFLVFNPLQSDSEKNVTLGEVNVEM